jgi:ABC-type phosphate transport system permease subunit
VCDPAAPSSVVAEVQLSAASPGRTARLVLHLGYATAETTAVARDLAGGVLSQVEAMLADPATDLPAHLRGALAALAGALTEQTEQTGDRATITPLNTPLARAWRAHPAGRGQ